MSIVINGSGTVTGLSVGGLPDGTVDSGTIATGTIVDADVANVAASKLTGALPAIDGASLTGINIPSGRKNIMFNGRHVTTFVQAMFTNCESIICLKATIASGCLESFYVYRWACSQMFLFHGFVSCFCFMFVSFFFYSTCRRSLWLGTGWM